MRAYKIIVGEDVDLPETYLKKENIGIFNYSITLDEKSYSKESLYKQMRLNKVKEIAKYPQTSQPSTGYFVEMLEKALKEYKNIVLITISSDLSGTHNAATQAILSLTKDHRERILLIDSRNGSVSEALIVMGMIEYCKSHADFSDIQRRAQELILQVRLITTIDDPTWLEAGGRISRIKAVIMKQMMKIGVRPILSVNNGKVELLKIKANVKEKTDALFYQFKDEIDAISEKEGIKVIISHGDNKKEAELLQKRISSYNKNIEIEFISCCSAVFGAHLGPDCILLGWLIPKGRLQH